MNKLLISIVSVLAATFVPATHAEKSPDEIHTALCKASINDYPAAFVDLADCMEITRLESDSSDEYSISFVSCATGEWVTATYSLMTDEVLIGSSGAEDDMCE